MMQIKFAREFMLVPQKPTRTRFALWWDDRMQAFCLRMTRAGTYRMDWMWPEGIEAFIDRVNWLDRRQKGRLIRRSRKIRRRLVPMPT